MKVLKHFDIKQIEVFVYYLNRTHFTKLSELEYKLKVSRLTSNKTIYEVYDGHNLAHKSTLFKHVFLLRLIKKSGPVIGDCFTYSRYRGLSIYPKVIHYIAKQCLFNKGTKEVFMMVDILNKNSIKGIEKAGFVKLAEIHTKRWLWFYFKSSITYPNIMT